tara:strand:- start:594 stop:722 length:129 start_codon:yes stop_codon:yes gene_type:complete
MSKATLMSKEVGLAKGLIRRRFEEEYILRMIEMERFIYVVFV